MNQPRGIGLVAWIPSVALSHWMQVNFYRMGAFISVAVGLVVSLESGATLVVGLLAGMFREVKGSVL